MAQTTLVLVHGAWHPPSAWDAFLPALQPLGLRTSIVSLPSVNGQIKDYKQGEDTAAVRDAIVKELDAGHDVAVVAHSYGGFPTAEAVQGLAKSDRNGKSGVVKLIYLAAFAIPKGATMLDGVGGEPLEWWNLKDDVAFPSDPEGHFFNTSPKEAAKKVIDSLRPQNFIPRNKPLEYEGYRHIPSAYLICLKDQAIPLEGQEAMAASGFELVERLDCDHSPYLSAPKETAAFIKKALEL